MKIGAGKLKKRMTFLTVAFHSLQKGRKRSEVRMKPLKIGHRGAAGYCPENTFASFYKAIESGVDYLEIDLQMTKDGELVIIHDSTVNRTTNGKGKVKDMTLQELQSLDAGSWFDPKFMGEKIPSLHEFLNEFAGKACLLIELKKPSLYPNIEIKLAEELKSRGLDQANDHRIIVQSFDRNALKRLHYLLPAVPLGVLVKNRSISRITDKDLKSLSNYISYVNPKKTMVSKRLIKRIQRHGFKTFIWTVKTKKEANLFSRLNIDGIVSDFPDYL